MNRERTNSADAFSFKAFSPGSDLWVVPALEQSAWTRKIDWKLNFQIAKSQRHQRPQVAQELKTTLEKCHLPLLESPATDKSLMIASHPLLPNRWLVVVDKDVTDSQYLKVAAQISQKMSVPQARIFLSTQNSKNLSIPSSAARLKEVAPQIKFEFVQETSHARQ